MDWKIANKLKLLICGTLLAGLVISNAFKSENVYNIVSPRQLISYRTLDELVEDNFTIYSRIVQLDYTDLTTDYEFGLAKMNGHQFSVLYGGYFGMGASEALYTFHIPPDPLQKKLLENSQIHPDTEKIYVESIKIVKPLLTILKNQASSFIENTLKLRFSNNQKKLISDDMHNCSKTAWILPSYLAQDIFRDLTKSGNHSDVGTYSYSNHLLYLKLSGLLPLSLQNQFSKISASGVIEWWPNFINRTDFIRTKDNVPPTKPNMHGHTQVIFIMLSTGLLIAFCSLLAELSGKIAKWIKLISNYFRAITWGCIQKFKF